MSIDDHSARDRFHQLRKLKPTKEQDREEGGTAPAEGTFSVQGLAIEERANDESIRKNDKKFGIYGGLISKYQPELALSTSQHLAQKADGET